MSAISIVFGLSPFLIDPPEGWTSIRSKIPGTLCNPRTSALPRPSVMLCIYVLFLFNLCRYVDTSALLRRRLSCEVHPAWSRVIIQE